MNFRVDLILAEEQRSASILSPKSIIRIIAIVVPSAIVLLIAKFAFGVYLLGNDAAAAERKWTAAEPRAQKAGQVREALNANLGIVDELTGWKETHINWHEQLAAIQAAVPTNIQLTELSIQQSLVSSPDPSRRFLLRLAGRSISDATGTRVVELKRAFGENALLKSAVKSAEVVDGSFVNDPSPQAKKDDRLFRIECAYSERVFK
jgi:hypothetical protein